jgi:2-oxoglutarate dehydrogenase E2 component (dihydrolipoamide succinyltransferase)
MDVTMPQLGETVTEGTITRWFKHVGDAVKADEPLFEVSTDKVDSEVPAPESGVLSEIVVQEGETVPVGARLAVIGDSGGAAAAPPAGSGSGARTCTRTRTRAAASARSGRGTTASCARPAAGFRACVITGSGACGRECAAQRRGRSDVSDRASTHRARRARREPNSRHRRRWAHYSH